MTAELPLPDRVAERLGFDAGTNRSLLFDRGFDRYSIADDGVEIPKENGRDGKSAFLDLFAGQFEQSKDFGPFIERRRETLKALHVRHVFLYTESRLVCGMGLPHPTGNGLLLDRLTGCPYLPGSTVKGLLRAAAKLMAEGELEGGVEGAAGDSSFWREHRDAVFGPDRSASEPARGQAVFFDAFPTEWPTLEVDVLTPHYQPYYAEGAAPGDWHDPVPVSFLTVAPGTPFDFAFRAAPLPHTRGQAEADATEQLARLLPVALEWLGVGGKKGAGYGVFGSKKPPVVLNPVPEKGGARDPSRDPGPPPKLAPRKKPKQSVWKNVELRVAGATATVWRGTKQSATCAKDDLPAQIVKKLKKVKKNGLVVDAVVVQQGGGRWRIDSVEESS